MSVRHLVKGSALPAVNPDLLRIYSMRFCPFAERTRLVAAHKGIPHEIVNVHVRNKPEWLFNLNPNGTVPIIEYKGQVIYDSAVTCQLLEEVFPGTESEALLPADPFKRAEIKLFLALSDTKTRNVVGVIYAQSDDARKECQAEWLKGLSLFEDRLTKSGGQFFGGAHVGMVDLHIWPFFERIPVVKAVFGIDLFPVESYPHLAAWFAAMKDTHAVKHCEVSIETYKRFYEPSNMEAEVPNCDVELD